MGYEEMKHITKGFPNPKRFEEPMCGSEGPISSQRNKISAREGPPLPGKERLDDCAERFNFFCHPCELCNERGHLNLQCKLFHDQIMSKNYDNLITLEHHKELSLILGYEEMKRITEGIPKCHLERFVDFI